MKLEISKLNPVRDVSDIFKEREEYEQFIRELLQERKELLTKLRQYEQPTTLLKPDEIARRIGNNLMVEVGALYPVARMCGAGSAGQPVGNLLVSLQAATRKSGEYSYYKDLFETCGKCLDEAVRQFSYQNFPEEMRLIRWVQNELSGIVARGYGTMPDNMWEVALADTAQPEQT